MADGIMSLFEGNEQLSEDFKTGIQTIFEATVNEKVAQIRADLEEANKENLQEQANVAIADMEQKIDNFLTYVAEEWMEKNEVAIDKGIETEISESFLTGIKSLFDDHYVSIPEDKVDVVAEMAETIDEMESDKNDAVNENIALKAKVMDFEKKEIVAEMTEGLADSEKDKISTLVAEMTFEDEDSFRGRLNVISENFLGKQLLEADDEDEDDDDDSDDDDKDDKKDKKKKKNPFVKESKNDGGEIITENVDPVVQGYATAMNRNSKY